MQLSADGLATARGTYSFSTDQLTRYRRAVALELPGEALVAVADTVRAAGLTITAAGRLAAALRASAPLVGWLDVHVGPPDV